MRIYKINAVANYGRGSDRSIPFQHFYLVPQAPYEELKLLSPYALLLPLNGGYEQALTKRGLNFEELEAQNYQVLVPLHMKRVGRERVLTPAYISNKIWHQQDKKRQALGIFFPDDSALITPKELIQPMSLACERHLEHFTGDCRLGTPECASHILIPFDPVKPPNKVNYAAREARTGP